MLTDSSNVPDRNPEAFAEILREYEGKIFVSISFYRLFPQSLSVCRRDKFQLVEPNKFSSSWEGANVSILSVHCVSLVCRRSKQVNKPISKRATKALVARLFAIG